MNYLVTGAAGFYGHHLLRYLLTHNGNKVVGIDRLDCAGNLNRIAEINAHQNPNFKFIYHDFRSEINDLLIKQIGDIDIVFHVGAASHVDRSIQDPMSFVQDNVVGTCNMLEYARKTKPKKFFYFSTDEVFGPSNNGKFKEYDRLKPGNPYAATKAGGEDLCVSYHNTYDIPIIITHCMNIFGERQHPEKFIPKVIRYVEDGDILPIYADKTKTIPGSRHYIYADVVTEALMLLVEEGEPGEKYNIPGQEELDNLSMAEEIATRMSRYLRYYMVASDKVRPGNDFSYGLDGSKMATMGFMPDRDRFYKQLHRVIDWYLENPKWYRL